MLLKIYFNEFPIGLCTTFYTLKYIIFIYLQNKKNIRLNVFILPLFYKPQNYNNN